MVSIAIVICKHLSWNKPLSLSSWTAGAWTTLRFVSTSHKSARSWTSFDFANLFKIKWAYTCSRFISDRLNTVKYNWLWVWNIIEYDPSRFFLISVTRLTASTVSSISFLSYFTGLNSKWTCEPIHPAHENREIEPISIKETYIFLLFSNSSDASQVSSLPLAFL